MWSCSLSELWLVVLFCASCSPGAALGSGPPLVDLGYACYEGLHDSGSGLDIWRGIRYAAPPTGSLRWQEPQPPRDERRAGVIEATELRPICPQAGAFGTPPEYGFNGGPGDEDCLFLNVYAPSGASDLPVLVWIHGGGYSLFGARYDPGAWIKAGGSRFVAVEIQYRLGAFGFLASPEVRAKGQLNAGLLDQRRALEWVQQYIGRFGGDTRRVTVAGESSGAGSAMHHVLAYGGREDGLFTNVYVSSPYLPSIHTYDDAVPLNHYNRFAELAGCAGGSRPVFECLVAADSSVLQNASDAVSVTQGYFGSFAWLPVVDGSLIRGSPAAQLLRGAVAGERVLVGTNANEGVPLTNPRVTTREQYDKFVASSFSQLDSCDRRRLESVYRIDEALGYGGRVFFDTTGSSGPTALVQSGMATGIQQAVFNMAAEATFDCPAQWLAEAFARRQRAVWRYQYSLTPSYHGADLSALFDLGSASAAISPDFRVALRSILSAFVASNSPVVSSSIATGGKHNASAPLIGSNLLWPPYTLSAPTMLNLNTSGGQEAFTVVSDTLTYVVRSGPGVVNTFRLADSHNWEGGRATRCDFWKSVALRMRC